jgi:hypothetical protein
LNRSKFDVICISWERQIEDSNFGEQVVGGSLSVRRYKGRPSSGTPPSNDKTEESAISKTASFSSPASYVRACLLK